MSASAEEALRDEIAQASARLEELRTRLEEPEEIVRAIRRGEVDAFVVEEPSGERIYNLRRADALYRRMVEEMQEGAVVLEASGLIVYANAYLARLLRLERSDLVGTSLFRFLPEESRPFFEGLIARANDESQRAEFVLSTADGEKVPVHASMSLIEIDDGVVYSLIITDLTMEHRRAELLAQVRQQDAFLAMLAHELRNPIAPIKNASHVIGLAVTNEPRISWARDVIDRQVTQLGRLVDDLLDVSRITQGKIHLDLRPLDLVTAVTRGIEMAQPSIDARRHELTVSLPEHRLFLTGDAARLAQVVANLLQNAAKFTPEGGKISLGVEELGSHGRIVVRDNGIGIRPEILPRIFDLFAQGDSSLERAQDGLGIGLALVRSLVEMHGGRVDAMSAGVGQGSEFVVSLPLREQPSEHRASPERESQRPAARKRRILVVDDNEDAAESMTLLLRELGHEVRMLTQGRAVLDTALEFRPEVVVLDISLPDVSGFDVALELRKTSELEHVCLVALTGYGQAEYRRRSSEVGIDRHFVKPVDLGDFEEFLNSLPSSRA